MSHVDVTGPSNDTSIVDSPLNGTPISVTVTLRPRLPTERQNTSGPDSSMPSQLPEDYGRRFIEPLMTKVVDGTRNFLNNTENDMQATDPSNTADRNASKLEDLSAEELGQIVEDAVRYVCASHFSSRKKIVSKRNPMQFAFHNAVSGSLNGTTEHDTNDVGTRIDEGPMDRSRHEQGSVSAPRGAQEADTQGGITLQIWDDPTMTVDQLLAVPRQSISESDTAQSGCSGWPGTVGPRSEIVIDHEDEDSGQYRQPDTPWDSGNSTRVVLCHTDDGTWARFKFDATPTRAMELRQQRRMREQGTDVY